MSDFFYSVNLGFSTYKNEVLKIKAPTYGLLTTIKEGLPEQKYELVLNNGPVSLRCEYQVNPKGIDISKPSLSWLFVTAGSSLRGQKQSAYQVLVASRPEILAGDSGDLWNSGLPDTGQQSRFRLPFTFSVRSF